MELCIYTFKLSNNYIYRKSKVDCIGVILFKTSRKFIQENLVKTFFSITDESIGMKHFRYTNDDYFSADDSIKPIGKTHQLLLMVFMLNGLQLKTQIQIKEFYIYMAVVMRLAQ